MVGSSECIEVQINAAASSGVLGTTTRQNAPAMAWSLLMFRKSIMSKLIVTGLPELAQEVNLLTSRLNWPIKTLCSLTEPVVPLVFPALQWAEAGDLGHAKKECAVSAWWVPPWSLAMEVSWKLKNIRIFFGHFVVVVDSAMVC